MCGAIRAGNPVIHSITNYVAMNFNANVLLAVGASPVMSACIGEMEELGTLSQALYVNIGCPDDNVVNAARKAVTCAGRDSHPWVLDPVGAGATRLRTEIALELAEIALPAIIRGNASEIIALAGGEGNTKGVDSNVSSDSAVECAKSLARRLGCVIVVSGPTDYITDGNRVLTVGNGSPMMCRVSGMGCTASALCAAFAAVSNDSLMAAWSAMALMGVAGERAASSCRGLGSLQTCMLDELSTFSPAEYAEQIKFNVKDDEF